MTNSNLIQSAILAWIVIILLSIACGPMIKMRFSMKDYANSLSVHKKLQNLNINATSSDFDGIKNTTKQLFNCMTGFLACVLGLSIMLTILMICPEKYCRKILDAAERVLLTLFTAAFVGLTIWSGVLYVNLYNEQIDPYKMKQGDLHDQMISSLKGNFRNDNLTTGTKISNEWNLLFIDFECCGVNRVAGTTNDFDETSWCTTTGSCQATASQIPKTCCKGLTEYDYQNAPTACHSSVSPGYYYDKGCFSVIKKEVIRERILFYSFTEDILTEGLRVILVMGSCSLLCLCGTCVFTGSCLREKEETLLNASNVPYQSITENGTNLLSSNTSHTSSMDPTLQIYNASITTEHPKAECPTEINNSSIKPENVNSMHPNTNENNDSTPNETTQTTTF